MAGGILFSLAFLIFSGFLLLGSPGELDAFPWSIDMYRGETAQPLAVAPRVMPSGTMPTTGAELPRSRIALIRTPNPLPPTREHIRHGRGLYAMTCAPCHGVAGRGDGPVKRLLRVPPIDLSSDAVRWMADGYIYGTIRNGSIQMPPYGDALSVEERWEIVLYVRSLQGSVAFK